MNTPRILYRGIYVAAVLALNPGAAQADVAPAFSGTKPPQLKADPDPTASGHLKAAEDALNQAQAVLTKATTDNHGGFVEKARADVKKALADAAEADTFIKAHPEANALLPGPAPTETSTVHSAIIPENDKVPGLNMMAAVDALNVALNEFINDHASGYKGPLVGPIGGYREKIMADIRQADTDVLAAIQFAADAEEKKSQSPRPDTKAPPPAQYVPLPQAKVSDDGSATANVTTSQNPRNLPNGQSAAGALAAIDAQAGDDPPPDNAITIQVDGAANSLLPTAIAGIALSVAISLGGLHFSSRNRRAAASAQASSK